MSDHWDFYPLLVDDEPASIFLDLGIAASAPVDGHHLAVFVQVPMLRPRPDGLSSQEEFDDLVRIEDELTRIAREGDRALYVGRNTTGGNRDFFFYTRDSEPFLGALREVADAFPAYRFESGVREDPDWGVYFDFLYPSPEALRKMANRGVLTALAEHGDRHGVPRDIDHFADFEDMGDCLAFAAWVREQGFRTAEPVEQDGTISLAFARMDSPDDIDEIAPMLERAVTEHRGSYDGWGCEVRE